MLPGINGMEQRKYIPRLLLTAVFMISLGGYAQNLVPNSSFEIFYKKTHEKGVDVLRLWYIPTRTSSDYFNTKVKGLGNPKEEIVPHTGTGYTGILAFDKREAYREYMSVKLNEQLKQYHVYRVSYYVQLSAQSTYASNAIGAAVTAHNPLNEHKHDALGLAPQIKPSQAIQTTGNWILVTEEFVASGGEEFLTIGNFNTEDMKGAVQLKEGKPMAYYYFDDVSLEFTGEVRKPTSNAKKKMRSISLDPEPEEKVEVSETMVLENIHFQSGNAILEEASFTELQKLVQDLSAKKGYKMEIYGHTDNVGDPKYNLKLSEARAKAVVDYLISQGIAPSQLSYKGYGDTQPKYTNDTEKGRQMNRRVEFKLISG